MSRLTESVLSINEVAILRSCINGDDCLFDHPTLYNKLVEYYIDEMPYEVQKARSGQDPETWLLERVEGEL